MRSIIFALKGIKTVLLSERNAVIHTVIALLVIVCGIFFQISKIEWLAVLLCIGLVVTAEIFNTAVERLVDLVSPQRNEKAGMVKDIAAGAVLVSAIISAIVGIIVFLPHLIDIAKIS